MGDRIKVIGSRLSQGAVEVLGVSGAKFGNEMGSRTSSLNHVRGGLSAVWEIWRNLRTVSYVEMKKETISKKMYRPQCLLN